MSAEGYTVLIVEQNIRQVLKVVDRAYLLETGRIKSERRRRAARQRRPPAGVYWAIVVPESGTTPAEHE